MKLCIFLFFAFVVVSAQENDFCNEYLQKEKLEFQKFKEKELISQKKYTALRVKVFSDIRIKKEIKADNIFLCIVSDTFVNDDISNDKDCRYRSTLYYNKRGFLDSLFWNKDTFDYVKKHFNKNIFPVINHNGNFHLTKENFKKLFSNGEYKFILDFPTTNLLGDKKEIYFIPSKGKHRKAAGKTKILVVFKDYESANNVEVIITNYLSKPIIIRKKYQYIHNQWKLMETQKENK